MGLKPSSFEREIIYVLSVHEVKEEIVIIIVGSKGREKKDVVE